MTKITKIKMPIGVSKAEAKRIVKVGKESTGLHQELKEILFGFITKQRGEAAIRGRAATFVLAQLAQEIGMIVCVNRSDAMALVQIAIAKSFEDANKSVALAETALKLEKSKAPVKKMLRRKKATAK